MSILAVRKPSKPNVNFHVSRLVEAVWMQPNGSAQVMVEGMLTAEKNTESFDSFEILIPMEIDEALDATESFLDEDLWENNARYSYKQIDKAQGIIELSRVKCRVIYPLRITLLHNHEYTEMHVAFPQDIQPGEAVPFRVMFKVPKYANRTRSYYQGLVTHEFSASLYDILQIEHSKNIRKRLESQKSRLVRCERVYLWVVSPPNVEVIRMSPPPSQVIDYAHSALLSKDRGPVRRAVCWEPGTQKAFPWSNTRFSGTFRKQSPISITMAVAILGVLIGLVSLVFEFLV